MAEAGDTLNPVSGDAQRAAENRLATRHFDQLPTTLENLSVKVKATLKHLGVADREKVAVAVSGGADSLALVLAVERIAPVVALTVDHGLRDGSRREAEKVQSWLADRQIDHHILTWDGEKPQSNVQAAAREARYRLLEDWCAAEGISYLLTGHQRDDLAETFMLRLMRGSGVDGLAAMPMSDKGLFHPDFVTRLRPLLSVTRGELEAVLKSDNIPFISDPSNEDTRFERVKVRQFLRETTLEGLTVDRLADTAERMRWARDALESQTRDWFYRAASLSPFGSIRLSARALEQAPKDTGLRLLVTSIGLIAGSVYKPRLSSLARLYDSLVGSGFTGQTLNGVIFEKSWGDGVFLIREVRAMPKPQPILHGALYDNRWRITVTDPEVAKDLRIAPLGEKGWNQLKLREKFERLNELRHNERLCLPAFFKGSDCIGLAISLPEDDDEDIPGAYVSLVPPFFDTAP